MSALLIKIEVERHRVYAVPVGKQVDSCTDPPLNAPTGLFTGGATTASCNCGLVVCNDLVKNGEGVLIARVVEASRGRNAREAMATEEGSFGSGDNLSEELCDRVDQNNRSIVRYSGGTCELA